MSDQWRCAMSRLTLIVSTLIVSLLTTGMEFASAHITPATPTTVHQNQSIPRDHYKSWSLFLICNPGLIIKQGKKCIPDIFKACKVFGDSICSQKLALLTHPLISLARGLL
jgi:hypothetical protein